MSDVVGEYSFFLSVFLLYRSKSDLMLFPLLLLWSFPGAKPAEVSAQSTLTQNLHTMLQTFYRPNAPPTKPSSKSASTNGIQTNGTSPKPRHKIIYETKAFPSDQYALRSAIELAGFNPETSLIPLTPREGELTLRTEDILKRMEELAEEGETAIIMMAGIQYYTGQWFEMEKITRRGKELVSYDWIVPSPFFPCLVTYSDSFNLLFQFIYY